MSKLAKKPLIIPSGVKVSVNHNVVVVEGKLGKTQQTFEENFVDIKVDGDHVNVNRKGDTGNYKAAQGLYYRLIQGQIQGVTEGFLKTLNVQGLGYKWEIKGKTLIMNVGFSKPYIYQIPEGITLKSEKPEFMAISGANKQLVGQVAAELRAVRPPEPYKGKGVRYLNEHIKLKEGKAAK